MTLDGFMMAHGSALILPLAAIEGPVVTILTGILSARGYFHWYWALCLLVCADLIGDSAHYWVGRTGGTAISGLGRHLGVPNVVGPWLQEALTHNTIKMLLIGKWTHSIGGLVLIGSGALRLPLARFILVNLFASMPKSAVLLGFGYFASDYYPLFERHFIEGTIALCVLGGAVTFLLLWRADCICAGRIGR
jgi:membrane-associated protein